MALQQRNDEQMDLLRSEFQARYEPNFAWRAAGATQALTGLRVFYPMSAVGTAGQARDLGGSGQAFDLTNNNSADFGYDQLAPYCDYDGANQYHSFADNANFDIIGTEAYIVTAQRGLTIAGWFEFDDDPPAATEYLIAKWVPGVIANASYALRRRQPTTDIEFAIGDGAAVFTIDTVAVTSAAQWYFIAGRYESQAGPAEIAVILKSSDVDETTVNAAGIPAAIVNGAASFTIAASGTPGNYLDGRASLVFVCTAALSDAILDAIFQQTRAMYGV